MFPGSPFIHIGGDEVSYDQWASSTTVKELMSANHLATNDAVRGWFLQKVEDHVNMRGKQIIGWDEILEGGPPTNCTVMSWQGLEGGVRAANSGHQVIMSPNSFAYFDRPQSDPSFEPMAALGSPLPLRDVYDFDPLPKEIDYEKRDFVLGAQGCLWTEFIKTPGDVEFMAFPRVIALSEALWSPSSGKSFPDFQHRLADELERLDRHRVNYRIPEPIGLFSQNLRAGQSAVISLRPSVSDSVIYYTLDGTIPTEKSERFPGQIKINIGQGRAVELKVRVVTTSGRQSQVFSARYSVG